MIFASLPAALLCIFLSSSLTSATLTYPEQISVAAKEVCCDILVTWVTFDPTDVSQVKYVLQGSSVPPSLSAGNMTKFVDDGDAHIVRYIHRVQLTGLNPSTKYDYNCGSPANWSATITLRTLGNDMSSPVFAVYGDLGTENAVSLPYLISDADKDLIHGVLHIGDMAYDMFDDDGRNGDKFMNNLQPLASRIPYMVGPGNHETKNNFSQYVNRYSMPGDTKSLYYSWDVGPAHIISMCTEFFFTPEYGPHLADYHHHWLEDDLKQANSQEQRAKHPWIITMGHRPMYCSTMGNDDCNLKNGKVRTDLEDLLYSAGVDIMFWGHNHIYQRVWPIYNYKVMNGSTSDPYTDPKAPVHIVSGASGNYEGHAAFLPDQPDWVAVNSQDYSYTRMTIHNATHISMEQISTDKKKGEAIDQIMIIKNHHGPRN